MKKSVSAALTVMLFVAKTYSTMQTTKKIYTVPAIESILIDNEISLSLESAPPDGPGEIVKNNQDFFNNNPFHTENA